MNLKPPRGTRDLLPEETERRQKIYSKLRDTFRSYGYGEVETPAFESFDLLAAKSGPEIEEEIYAFKDKGGRKLGLRFDPTVPIARIVASDPSKPKPIKYFYLTRMWRYERPQSGRYREFWQAGCELIGPDEPEADAEILKIADECLRTITGEDFIIKVNSREISEAIAGEIGVPEEDKLELFRAVDKLDKKTQEEVEEELNEKNVNIQSFREMLERIKNDEVPEEAKENLEETIKKAEEMGVENVEIDLSITRGLDYYTGFVFETFVKGAEEKGSVCSGGRYNSLIGIYGNEDIPATGFGLGIDRLLDIANTEEDYSAVDFYICPVKDKVRSKAREITQTLREAGFKADTDLMKRSLSKQFKYIDSMNIPYALVVGPRELEENQVTVRNMENGDEEKIPLDKLKEKAEELL